VRHEARQDAEYRVQIDERPTQDGHPFVRECRDLGIEAQASHTEISEAVGKRYIDLARNPVEESVACCNRITRNAEHAREVIPRAKRKQPQGPMIESEFPHGQIQRPIAAADDDLVDRVIPGGRRREVGQMRRTSAGQQRDASSAPLQMGDGALDVSTGPSSPGSRVVDHRQTHRSR